MQQLNKYVAILKVDKNETWRKEIHAETIDEAWDYAYEFMRELYNAIQPLNIKIESIQKV